MDQLVSFRLTCVQRLPQRIDHEGDIDKTLPGQNVGEIADPTVQRATSVPSHRSWRQTLSAP